ncbi:hypothetical protein ACI79P_18665 [Blastococcus sp. SYSU DS0510]
MADGDALLRRRRQLLLCLGPALASRRRLRQEVAREGAAASARSRHAEDGDRLVGDLDLRR